MAYKRIIKSPVGYLELSASLKGLESVKFISESQAEKLIKQNKEDDPKAEKILQQAEIELQEYFSGLRKEFTVPLDIKGTEFQKKTWQNLKNLPYGQVKSYKYLAQTVGSPKGFRAVGMANNKNPLPIIIPCHRIVGSSGTLTGYAGGLDKKEFLLKMEMEYDFYEY